MTGLLGDDELPPTRRSNRIEHIWTSLGIISGVLVPVGVSLLIWGTGVAASNASRDARVTADEQRLDRIDGVIKEFRAYQTLINNYMVENSRVLGRVDRYLDLEDGRPPKR